MTIRAFVALGSNLDDPAAQVECALGRAGRAAGTALLARSSLYRTAPVGYVDQPDFINAVAQVETASRRARCSTRCWTSSTAMAACASSATRRARSTSTCCSTATRIPRARPDAAAPAHARARLRAAAAAEIAPDASSRAVAAPRLARRLRRAERRPHCLRCRRRRMSLSSTATSWSKARSAPARPASRTALAERMRRRHRCWKTPRPIRSCRVLPGPRTLRAADAAVFPVPARAPAARPGAGRPVQRRHGGRFPARQGSRCSRGSTSTTTSSSCTSRSMAPAAAGADAGPGDLPAGAGRRAAWSACSGAAWTTSAASTQTICSAWPTATASSSTTTKPRRC